MNDLEKIKCHCKEYGYDSRKYQYQIISDLTGVNPEVAKQICSMQRQIRFAIPKDSVGEKLEKDWHSPFVKSFECQANNQYKLTL